MKNLEQFTEKKELIISIYEEIKNSDLLSIEDKKILDEEMQNLQNGKFIVSVCGQIKVGKSTFLNDLIFEKILLPAASTPETAKLSEINFGESGYTAEFYSLDEWNIIKNQEIETNEGKVNYYDKYIKPSINDIIERTGEPIHQEEILSKNFVSGQNFDSLKDYISAKGKYTPFVKNIKIFSESPILNGVTIVDTPGTNDPNEMRAKITEEWIGKSDAVIFLMFAGQAFSVQDSEFIEKFLLSVPTEKILIGLSKIDVVEDYSRPQKYVEDALMNSNLEGFAKSIKDRSIYPIAPLFSLYPKIYKKFENDELTLNDDEIKEINYQLNKRAKGKPNIQKLIENKGLMPEFKLAIEENLIKNKGETLLKSHSKNIISVFEKHKMDILSKKGELNEKINLISLSEKDLEKKINEVEKAIDEIDTLEREISNNFDKLKNNLTSSVMTLIRGANQKISEEILEIVARKEIHYIITNLVWDAKSITEKHLGNTSKEISKSLEEREKEIGDIQYKIKERLHNFKLFSSAYIDSISSSFDIEDILGDIEDIIKSRFSASVLENLKKSKLLFWTNKKETKNNFEKQIKELYTEEKGIKMILEGALNKLKEKISTLSQSMIDNIRKNLTEKNRTLKGLEENRDKLLSDIPNIRKKITELDLESKELDKKILDIKERLGVNLLSDIPNTREKITELDLEGNELDKKMDDVKERLGVNL